MQSDKEKSQKINQMIENVSTTIVDNDAILDILIKINERIDSIANEKLNPIPPTILSEELFSNQLDKQIKQNFVDILLNEQKRFTALATQVKELFPEYREQIEAIIRKINKDYADATFR